MAYILTKNVRINIEANEMKKYRHLVIFALLLLIFTASCHLPNQNSIATEPVDKVPPSDATDVYPNGKTRFGILLTPANHPNITYDDFVNGMLKAAAVGGHVSYIANWPDAEEAIGILSAIKDVADVLDLITIFQISPTSVNEPAPPGDLPHTFSDPEVRARYLSDVEAIASIQPDYLNIAGEINLMAYFNREEFDHFASLYGQAYDIVKAVSPDTQVGVSYHLTAYFTVPQFDLPNILGPQDFYGISSYPSWTVYEGHYPSIAEIPAEYFDRLKVAFPEAPIIFTEIGWTTAGQGNEADQQAFIRRMPDLLRVANPRFISWAMLHDVQFFSTDIISDELMEELIRVGVDPVLLFEELNSIGLFYRNGAPKPGWYDALDLVFDYPEEDF